MQMAETNFNIFARIPNILHSSKQTLNFVYSLFLSVYFLFECFFSVPYFLSYPK